MFCFVDNTSVNDVCVCVCVCGEKRWRVRRMRGREGGREKQERKRGRKRDRVGGREKQERMDLRIHIEMDDTQQAMIGATMTNDILNTQMLESPAQGTS
jgi:hypothetical protein